MFETLFMKIWTYFMHVFKPAKIAEYVLRLDLIFDKQTYLEYDKLRIILKKKKGGGDIWVA